MDDSLIWQQEKKYMEKIIKLQNEVIESQREQIHHMAGETKSIDDASGREWNLSSALDYAKRDNKALRELCEDLRGLARAVGQDEILKFFGAKPLDIK